MKILKLLRIQQWVKNLLCFVPIISAHEFGNPHLLLVALETTICMSLVASTGYIFNDISDRVSDRSNPYKKLRPISSGTVTIIQGKIVASLCLVLGLIFSLHIEKFLVFCFFGYFCSVVLYTKFFKKNEIVNVVFLTFFYLFRILVGGIACSISISFWLAMFAFFFFLGLAHLKKTSDFVLEDEGRDEASILVSNFFGVASSYLSVLILGLYLNDPSVSASFSHPRILWLFIPLILISNMIVWRDCFRDKIRTDPVIYFIRNRGIQICLMLCARLFGLAL